MADVSTITLLYTANLVGKLELLPRLATLVQAERRAAAVTVLLDLGDTCALDAWICPATEGRAPLIVLDSMGYDAALVGGPEEVSIPPASLRDLAGRVMMSIILWGRAAHLTKRDTTLHLASGPVLLAPDQPGVVIDRSAPTLPGPGAPLPTLGDVPQGALARVDLAWPTATVIKTRLVHILPQTPADPTISAIIELVQAEARDYVQQRKGDS
ncbi:MAG: hypothetical protein GYB65_04720 [Chloroflexi bacterium]|nr:hypothetical protein [Chloroflexota bacterium]